MKKPAFQDFLDFLRSKTNVDSTTSSVIRIFRDEIDPKIHAMTKKALEEAFSEALWALYQQDCSKYVIEANLQHFEVEASVEKTVARHLDAELKEAPVKIARQRGRKGGQKPKRLALADEFASYLMKRYPNETKKQYWSRIPEESYSAQDLKTLTGCFEIYRDKDRLYAVDEAGVEKSMAKTTFFRTYLKK